MKREIGAQEMAICMGWDAFRICIGMKPVNFSTEEVMRWLRLVTTKIEGECSNG